MQGLTDGPVKTYLFRLEFDTLEEAIRVTEQEDFSMKQAYANSNSYLPSRRQENGGPEPIDHCNARSKSSRVNNYKKLQKYNRCQKTGYYAYECSAPSAVPRTAVNSNRQAAKKVPTLLQKRNIVTDSQKRSGSVGAEHPTAPATSSELAGLLTRIALNTQSLCVTASGNEVCLITLKLEVAKNMSLRALVDCGTSNNFVQRNR